MEREKESREREGRDDLPDFELATGLNLRLVY